MRTLQTAALEIADSEQRQAWARHAIAGERRSRLANIINLLPTIPTVRIDVSELDVDPDLFNVKNGTLILPEGRTKLHDPADNLTKLAGVHYDPKAKAPRWEEFQREICDGDRSLITFKQKAFGYSMSGHTSEEAMFIPYGTGANGKSTEQRVLARLFGDYAATAQAESFAAKRSDAIRNDIAALHGARFVTASEGENRARLNEGLIKQLTGRDAVTARFLYQEPFTFTPAFKIWFATNHKPIIYGTDEGIWRRIRLIPYAVSFPPDERDPNLDKALIAELPGILNWLITGYLMWRHEGLGTAPAIDQATKDYRRESDSIHDFLEACCDTSDPAATTASRHLHAEYTRWCEANGDDPLNANLFGRLLTEHGHNTTTQRVNGRTTKVRTGISLQIGNTGNA